MFISIFCKFAVPLFFAISGVLMLKKAETVKKNMASQNSKVHSNTYYNIGYLLFTRNKMGF